MGQYEVRASEAEQEGTERGSGWGIQRKRWGRAALFWEELEGMVTPSRKQEPGELRLELEMDSEQGLVEMEEVVAFFWAG